MPVRLSLLLALVAATGAPPPRPLLELDSAGVLSLSRVPPVLDDETVAKQLRKGLTTVLLFRLRGVRGGEPAAGARIEVRYDIWDEVFHMTRLDVQGREHFEEAPDDQALREWWSSLRVPLLDSVAAGSLGSDLRVILDVLPFSQAEEADARRWFAAAAERSRRPRDGPSTTVEDGGDASVLGLLMATSIRRRPVRSFTWQAERAAPGLEP